MPDILGLTGSIQIKAVITAPRSWQSSTCNRPRSVF